MEGDADSYLKSMETIYFICHCALFQRVKLPKRMWNIYMKHRYGTQLWNRTQVRNIVVKQSYIT
jgi:hypothetical protein